MFGKCNANRNIFISLMFCDHNSSQVKISKKSGIIVKFAIQIDITSYPLTPSWN